MADYRTVYEYVCGTGRHHIASKTPITRCLAPRCPEPALKRVGQGSRKAATAAAATTGGTDQ